MNKEEILAKSREDKSLDEREKQLQNRMALVMFFTMSAVLALLFLWDVFRGVETSALSAIWFSGIAAMSFWQFYRYRMKSSIFFGLFASVATISCIVDHILSTL